MRELVYTLELPEETPSNNEIRGKHFHVYRGIRKAWRFRVENAAAAAGFSPGMEPVRHVHLEVDRYCSGMLDWDNAYGGLKPVLDCLVMPTKKNPDGLGLIFDDSPLYVIEPPYVKQHKAKPGAGRTVVRIYRVLP